MKIEQLIQQKALFVVNHSGGKDSQAMTILLHQLVPADQLVIVHAHLPEVEWDGTLVHINHTALGIPVHVTQSVKTFFEMVDHRGMFPDANRRQCTSDLKRGPIEREIRVIAKQRQSKIIVNCMGLRADESPGRAKKEALKLNIKNTLWPFSWKASRKLVEGRPWYDWLPIHDWSTDQVFDTIHKAGQKAFWIYYAGMTRKSCSFCIMGSQGDLKLAAKLRPGLYEKYVQKEKELGHTLQMSRKPLEEITGIKLKNEG